MQRQLRLGERPCVRSWSRPDSLATNTLTRGKAAVKETDRGDASRTELNLALAYAGHGRETAYHEMRRQAGWLPALAVTGAA